ncbi:zinc-ribbon domain-containing protein [Herpetosiphon sp. NSE202]|uniref:zinc-ribbon domain-containing protein n=1 Tax=Herpetosiphon sp. NSE202 TaxID=3351349 RepID=UPI00363B9523
MQCLQCSATIADNSKFCPSCGATITQPAAMDKTQVLSNLPPMSNPVDKTQAINPTQLPPAANYGAPAQPNYGPPAANYGQPAQPNHYQQPNYGQAQNYGQAPQAGYGQTPMGYAVPSQSIYRAIPATNGTLPASLMILSAVGILIGMFLPLVVLSGTGISLFKMIDPQYAEDVMNEGAALFIYGIPASAVISLGLSIMAYLKRRNLWGGLNIVPSLFVFGITGLLLIGAAVSDDIDEIGAGLLMMICSAIVSLLMSIAFLIRKKQPR